MSDEKPKTEAEVKKTDITKATTETKDIKEESKEEANEKVIMEAIKSESSHSLIQKLLYLNKINDDKEKFCKTNLDPEEKTLSTKYDSQYISVYQAIESIVTGETIPQVSADEKKEYNIQEKDEDSEAIAVSSPIPDYWSKVVINSRYFDMNDNDKKILKHLKNVKIVFSEPKTDDFTAEFSFETNDYFTLEKLTKSYFFDKDSIVKTVKGTEITWTSQDVNPTVKKKVVKVKKGKSQTKKTTYENVMSFFNFFNDKEKDDVSFLEDEVQFFKQDLFSNQLEYFLDIMDIEDDLDDLDDEEEEDEDDDDDEDEKPKRAKKEKKPVKKANKKGGDDLNPPKEECKNS